MITGTQNPFGVLDFLSWDSARFNHHYTLEGVRRSAALMKEAGVGFVRFDFLWEDIEPIPGQFNFEKYDAIVNALAQQHIRVLGILAYTPPWSGQPWNHSPHPVLYSQYARQVVEHFRGRVEHWQIWHEPDNPSFWHPQDRMQAYTELLRYTYPILKEVSPESTIVLGGMSKSLPMGLKELYARGGRNAFDALSIHPFANPLTPHAFEGLRLMYEVVRDIQIQNNDTKKPIWITEIGCPGVPSEQASHTPDWWLGKNPNEEEQAQWISTVYQEALKWDGVEKVFWCFFRETRNHFKSGSDYDGLIRYDFSRKPSFYAFQEAAKRYQAGLASGDGLTAL